MKFSGRRRLIHWSVASLALASVVGASGCFLERRVLFPGPVITDGSSVALDAHGRKLWLETPGARAEAFFLAATPGVAASGPLLIYTHGNGELIDYWAGEFRVLRDSGVSVLLVEYPGYGRSSGTPSQGSITRTLVAAYDWAVAQPGTDPRKVIGYGRSLGGGAICALSEERPLAALILESTFTSVRDMASERFGIPGFLVRNRFDNLDTVRGFDGPVLLLHGDRDDSIPASHAQRLHDAAKISDLEILSCGHNDCPRPWSSIQGFLSRHRLM